MSEVEVSEEGCIYASAGHQDDCKGKICRDVDRNLILDGESAVFILVELFVEGDEVNRCAEFANGSVDLDIPVVTLIIDVLNKQTQLFVDEAVTAGIRVDLV